MMERVFSPNDASSEVLLGQAPGPLTLAAFSWAG